MAQGCSRPRATSVTSITPAWLANVCAGFWLGATTAVSLASAVLAGLQAANEVTMAKASRQGRREMDIFISLGVQGMERSLRKGRRAYSS